MDKGFVKYIVAEMLPPCEVACPISMDIRKYVGLIAQGEFKSALRLIREKNPLPSICGRVCFHPCEEECRRGEVDEPLACASLKRFVADYCREEETPPKFEIKYEEEIAVIGSGPAGLTAAYDLVRIGYRVTLFERETSPGGMLTAAVPRYRLPEEIIRADIDWIIKSGVKIKRGVEIGKDLSIDDLKDEYQALLIATGLPISKSLKILGVESDGVYLALPFLRAINLGQRPRLGERVIVIGGGNVAVDVGRTARRLGAKEVTLVCLESKEEMPAFKWEIEAAQDEGVKLLVSKGPKRILSSNGRVTGLECKEVKSVFDSAGKFAPTFYEDRISIVEGQTVIIAIGQTSDLTFLRGSKVERDKNGQLIIDPESLSTTQPGVFAAGEIVSGPASVVEAILSAKRAALSIHRYLRGERLAGLDKKEPVAVGPLTSKTIEKIKKSPRAEMPKIKREKRVTSFEEVELGFTPEVAVQEAQRCLNCTAGAEIIEEEKCAACLTCVRLCPFEVPKIVEGIAKIEIDQCQACGVCQAECPRRILLLREDRYKPEWIEERINWLLKDGAFPQIIGFCCWYGPYADKLKLLNDLKVIKLFCVSRIDSLHLLKSFELGADGVLIVSCGEEDCRYSIGIKRIRQRIEYIKQRLDEIGLSGNRVEMYSASLEPRFVEEMTEKIRMLGPNPLRKKV